MQRLVMTEDKLKGVEERRAGLESQLRDANAEADLAKLELEKFKQEQAIDDTGDVVEADDVLTTEQLRASLRKVGSLILGARARTMPRPARTEREGGSCWGFGFGGR